MYTCRRLVGYQAVIAGKPGSHSWAVYICGRWVGPTVGDKVRLADTELWIEVEKDFTTNTYRVLAVHFVGWVHRAVGQLTVGGEHQQTGGVDVQTTDVDPAAFFGFGILSNTVGRPSGSSRVQISPSGLLYKSHYRSAA